MELNNQAHNHGGKTKKIALLMLVVFGAAGFWYMKSDGYQYEQFEKKVAALESSKQDAINEDIRQALGWEDQISGSDKPVPYTEAARYWRRIGEANQLDYPIERALRLYNDVFDKFGEDNAGLWQNVGGIYKVLERYDEAADAYEKAMILEPGKASHYIKLADVYRFHLDRPPEDILPIYEDALSRLVFGAVDILKSRAVYYEEIDQQKNALVDWARIYAFEPDNTEARKEYERLLVYLESIGEGIVDITSTSTVE